jgi:alpha-ketoglutarate-dependent taurine dioxygenase
VTTLAPDIPQLDVSPLTGTLGAEIRGVDLRTALDEATVAQIRRLWLRHKVVFFPEQHLAPAEQVAFARRFGALTAAHPVMPAVLPDHPEVLVIDNERVQTRPEFVAMRRRDREVGWHTDVTFMATPPVGSVLASQIVPAAGGDTLWADGEAAYASLDEPLRRLVDGLTALHDGTPSFGGFLDAGYAIEWDGVRRTALEPVEHPVVRTHPETGRKCLFVNASYTVGFEGMTEEESRPLLHFLFEQGHRPEFTCRFRWTDGAVAFWDNRCVKHLAIKDSGPFRRLMRRVQIAGDKPV